MGLARPENQNGEKLPLDKIMLEESLWGHQGIEVISCISSVTA